MFILRDYQQEAVNAAIECFNGKKNGIIVAPTGSGKSLLIASIATQLGGKTIVLQPTKEILEQNREKMRAFGYNNIGVYSASMGMKYIGNITFATIGSVIRKKHLFKDFDRIIIDECFVAGTKIDGINIEDIKAGDYVLSYNHHTKTNEKKKVLSTSKSPITHDLVLVKTNIGNIICTHNHPFYVEHIGYINAFNLREGDVLYANRTLCKGEELSNCSLHRMRNFNKESKSVANVSLQKKWKNLLFYFLRKNTQRQRIFNKNEEKKSHEKQANEGKSVKDVKTDGTQTKSARRKRKRNDTSTRITFSTTWKWLASRIKYTNKTFPKRWISVLLQGGFREWKEKDSYRNRWPFSLFIACSKKRQEEGRIINKVRVESVEVYKRGSEYGYSRCDKNNYVYNLEVEGNHNYYANNTLVHNCHLVNSKGGMYEKFITGLGLQTIGLTATPYRMRSYNQFDSGIPVAEARILTRTRPRIFNDIIHITQVKNLFERGYLCRLDYDYQNTYDSKKIRSNSTGMGFKDKSLENYNKSQNITDKIVKAVRNSNAEHCLAFTQFRRESKKVVEGLSRLGIRCEEISGTTPKHVRGAILLSFRRGYTKCVVNVGVLTTGYDFPELDCIILGRPTLSVGLYYQMIGRGVRTAPGKESCKLFDLCDNVKRFGKIECFELVDPRGRKLWRLKSDKGYLTGVNIITGYDLESTNVVIKKDADSDAVIIPFGKYKDIPLTEVSTGYLEWAVENFDSQDWKKIFSEELSRRRRSLKQA